MSFDRATLAQAIDRQGTVARVIVLNAAGSVPRDAGTTMLVWAEGQDGTIGGGALEYEALRLARRALATGTDHLVRQPLGPALAQCCGGTVTLLVERWDRARLEQHAGDILRRALPGTKGPEPLSVTRAAAALRSGRGDAGGDGPTIVDGWVVERSSQPTRPVWIYGAGHVGRALVSVLAPLPDFTLTWIDTGLDRYPRTIPEGVRVLPAANPADTVALAPPEAEHFVLTYSHALDLEICHRLLSHGFARAGLIGSATKWARFRKRLTQLGHADAQINRIACPIGVPELGKHPQAIAVGVVSGLLSQQLPKKAARAASD